MGVPPTAIALLDGAHREANIRMLSDDAGINALLRPVGFPPLERGRRGTDEKPDRI